MPDAPTAWTAAGRANVILDNLITRGQARPLIIVMPLGYGTMEVLNSGYVLCKRKASTRGHRVVPRCMGGRGIASTCHGCEDFIHKTWSHNELRDALNMVKKYWRMNDSRNSYAGSANNRTHCLQNPPKPDADGQVLPRTNDSWQRPHAKVAKDAK